MVEAVTTEKRILEGSIRADRSDCSLRVTVIIHCLGLSTDCCHFPDIATAEQKCSFIFIFGLLKGGVRPFEAVVM